MRTPAPFSDSALASATDRIRRAHGEGLPSGRARFEPRLLSESGLDLKARRALIAPSRGALTGNPSRDLRTALKAHLRQE